MNRHQRRAARKIPEARVETISMAEWQAAATICAWRDCPATFKGDMPPGWSWNINYYDPKPGISLWTEDDWARRRYHDHALCPEHTREFVGQFKMVGFREGLEALNKPEGSA